MIELKHCKPLFLSLTLIDSLRWKDIIKKWNRPDMYAFDNITLFKLCAFRNAVLLVELYNTELVNLCFINNWIIRFFSTITTWTWTQLILWQFVIWLRGYFSIKQAKLQNRQVCDLSKRNKQTATRQICKFNKCNVELEKRAFRLYVYIYIIILMFKLRDKSSHITGIMIISWKI